MDTNLSRIEKGTGKPAHHSVTTDVDNTNNTALSPPFFRFVLDNINNSFLNTPIQHTQTFTWFEHVLLIVCSIGLLGNCLNFFVLTRRRFRTSLNNLECSANYGLVALAASDLCYCIVVLPHALFPGLSGYMESHRYFIILLYKVYGIGCINLFQMTSTWIIVIIAINRWIVVKYPLRANRLIDKKMTIYSILVVCGICAMLSVPYFLMWGIKRYGPNYMMYLPWNDSILRALRIYLRWVWPVFASFIPLFVLIWCNVKLIIQIRKAIRTDTRFNVGRRLNQHKAVESKVTVTLIAIVVMYFIFVTPAEIIRYVNPYAYWGSAGIVVAQSLNLLQTVNFAFNFLLYCAVNITFRQTFREMIRPRRRLPSFRTNDDMKTLQTLISQRFALRSGSRSSDCSGKLFGKDETKLVNKIEEMRLNNIAA